MTFEQFVRLRLPALLRFAGVLIGDRHLAEDVVQDVLVRASERWSRIARLDAPEAYVRRMIVNQHLTWRRKWSRVIVTDAVPPAGVSPDHADRSADHDELGRRLDRLPPRQRAVLVLRYYEGLADAEIARVLGCAPGTVRSHAALGLAALRIDDTAVTEAAHRKGTSR